MGLLTKPNELTMKETYAGLIYGQPGVGKTTLALSGINPVCIDVDRGMYRVEKRYQVPSLQVENYQQVLDLLNSNELDGFDTIVIDTLGKLIDCIGEHVGKHYPKCRQSNGQLTQQGWGQLKVEFHGLVKLISGKNKSVIFVAHESEDKEGDLTKKRPDVSGSARKDIVKELDFMGYMEMSGNKRTISFSPSSAYYAKNSMGLDSVIEIPGIQTGNTFIKDVVVAAIRNRREQDKAQAGPYDETIKNIDAAINGVKDISTLNDTYAVLSSMDHILDSKLYAKSKISGAAKALNATWDKAANRFVGPAAPQTAVPKEAEQQRNVPPEGSAAPKPQGTNEKLQSEYESAKIELKKIMTTVDSHGNSVFSNEEYSAADQRLVELRGASFEERVKAIDQMLEGAKLALQKRLSEAIYGLPAETQPSDSPNAEQPEEEHTDDFEDDIPFAKEKVASELF